MASEGLRSPTALLGVVAAHMVLAWGLSYVVLHPAHVPEPVLVAVVSEPEPDIQAQPLPQSDVPLRVRRSVPARPPQPVAPPEVVPPPPLTQTIPEIEPLAPALPPVIEPTPVPLPVQAREPVAPLPVIAAVPSPPASTSEPTDQPAASTQPEAVSDAVQRDEAPVPPLFAADYLRNPKPNYPMMSRRLGEEGLVTLRVFVTAGGEPRQVELKQSCGFPRLDYAALEVVKNWRFVPAKRGDAPVDAWVVVPIRFTLKG